VADATETVALANRHFGAPVLLAGESLGAAVAAAAYARTPQSVAALWLITPWDRLAHVAQHHYPWLPVDWMLRDRYDTLSHLAQVQVPVAITLAETDNIVPPRFGQDLYTRLESPKRLWQVPDAGHNDWPYHMEEATWKAIVAYLLEARPTGD